MAHSATAKEQMIKLIEEQPDDSSYDDLLRALIFARMIERGLTDSENGRTLSSQELDQLIAEWPRPSSSMQANGRSRQNSANERPVSHE